MSNFLAVATVTATLRKTLQAAIDKDVPGAKVTSVRPDGTGSGTPATGLNLYLYQVSPNGALRNADLPSRSSEGQLIQRPQVALDLHYLLTFYGDDSELKPQRLLGSVVRVMHARPVLTRQMIRNTIIDESLHLEYSNLADAIETIKFTPIPLSLEELSKLWSIFFQTPHRLSIAYMASVVLIESEDVPQKALPVRGRNIYVVPFSQLYIESVVSRDGVDKPIVDGCTLVVHGRNLRGDITLVRIGDIEVTPSLADVSDTKISLPLPSGLLAGVHGLQVVHQMLMGTPPEPHRGVESNVYAFILHPTVNSVKASNISDTDIIGLKSADIELNISPDVGERQRVVLMLNEFDPPPDRRPLVYNFEAPSRDEPGAPKTTAALVIPVSYIKPAKYLVRVQIDGAESSLTPDKDEASPTFNQYISPEVEIDENPDY